jgi:hypothetical protein
MSRLLLTLCLWPLAWGGADTARAATKIAVAAVGSEAPGGGLFIGPSFTSWPAAAGNGWVAFRSQLEGGSSAEAIVASRFTVPVTRVQIARLGQRVGGAGSLRDFIGRPAITASGDVAFMAEFRPTEGAARIGIFLFDQAAPSGTDALRLIVEDGTPTAAGALNFGRRVDPDAPTEDEDTADRAIAINADGVIAFSAAIDPDGAGVFRATRDSAPTVVVRRGDAFGDNTFMAFGSPAINAGGAVAFRATLDGTDSEGIFVHDGATLTRKVARGATVTASLAAGGTFTATLSQFGSALTLNDAGDIGFTAGPLFDPDDPTPEPESGACVYRGGTTSLIAFPSQAIGLGRVSGVTLGTNGGFLVAPPAIAPNGDAIVFVSVNQGAVEAIRRVSPPYGLNDAEKVVELGGTSPDLAPTNGGYRSAASAPAVDATGAVAFMATLAGGTSPSAVIYRPVTGAADAVPLGDPAPITGSGYFGGPAFFAPTLTDAGAVIFKGFVARGETSVGIFKSQLSGTPTTVSTVRLVGANDPTPDLDALFLDLLGTPGAAADGTIAFAALASEGRGRGLYKIAPDGTITRIVERGDPAPGGGVFGSLGVSPSVNARGGVAFRASIRVTDDNGSRSIRGIFLADERGITTQVLTTDPAPLKQFVRFRDPAVSNIPTIAFRGTVGELVDPLVPDVYLETPGLFFYDGTTVGSLGIQGDPLSDGFTIDDFAGTPSFSANGDAVYVASRRLNGEPAGTALLRRRGGATEQVLAVGTPGPAGGTYKSVANPTMSPEGRILFRATLTTGPSGLFVIGENGSRPVVTTNETTPIEGRFSAFGARVSINTSDDIAFTASVTGGSARNALLVASPTTLLAPKFTVRLSGGQKRDGLRAGLTLGLSRLASADPTVDPIEITVSDANRQRLQTTIKAGTLAKKRGRFTIARGKSLPKELRAFQLVVGRKNTYQLRLRTRPLDLTAGGTEPIVGPLTVTVEMGNDNGLAIVRCDLQPKISRCGAR